VKYTTDQDGKSKTASAVDQEHYPEQHEVKNSPAYEDIAARAHELWLRRGSPHGSPELDWLEAEAQLNAARESHNVTNSMQRKGGSVQHE
jgi:hypothetical protein